MSDAVAPAVRIYFHAYEGWQVEWLGHKPDGGQSNYYYAAPVSAQPSSADAARKPQPDKPWICLLCKSNMKGRHGKLDDRVTPCPNAGENT